MNSKTIKLLRRAAGRAALLGTQKVREQSPVAAAKLTGGFLQQHLARTAQHAIRNLRAQWEAASPQERQQLRQGWEMFLKMSDRKAEHLVDELRGVTTPVCTSQTEDVDPWAASKDGNLAADIRQLIERIRKGELQ